MKRWILILQLVLLFSLIVGLSSIVHAQGSISLPQYIDGGSVPKSSTPTFSWGSVTGATSYKIEVCKVIMTNTACSSLAVPAATTTTTSWTPTTALPANTTLYWHVQAISTSFGSSAWSASQSFLSANPPPLATVTAPAYSALQGLTPTLTWKTAVTTAGVQPQAYRVQISTDPKFATTVVDTVSLRSDDTGSVVNLASTSTLLDSYTVSSAPTSPLQHGTQYYWRVRTLAGTSMDSAASVWAPATNSATTTGAFKTTSLSLPVVTAFSATVAQTTLTPTLS